MPPRFDQLREALDELGGLALSAAYRLTPDTPSPVN
jgi:hypothetical protein